MQWFVYNDIFYVILVYPLLNILIGDKVHALRKEESVASTPSKFFIGVTEELHPGYMFHNNNSNYFCEANAIVLFKCERNVEKGELFWKDNHGCSSEKYFNKIILLKIYQDVEERNLSISCSLNSSEITLDLLTKSNTDSNRVKNSNAMFYPKGADITIVDWCHGIVRYPNESITYVKPKDTLTMNFSEKENGSLLLCVSYNKTGVNEWERRVHYKGTFLIDDNIMNELAAPGDYSIPIVSTAATVTLIFAILLIIFFIYKKRQRSDSGTSAISRRTDRLLPQEVTTSTSWRNEDNHRRDSIESEHLYWIISNEPGQPPILERPPLPLPREAFLNTYTTNNYSSVTRS